MLTSRPGTVTILERERDTTPTTHDFKSPTHRPLKYDTSGRYILVPQPSDDPNDPLNWPRWKRDAILGALCLISVVATVLSPILAATSFSLLFVFPVGYTKIALLTGYHLMGVGVAGAFFVPSARVWGKRHLYLLGTLLVCATSAWGGYAGQQAHYTSFLWARIFQGVGLAPFEALVNASVGDLFFVHERGKRMALTTVSLFGSAFFAPVIVGKIAATQGFEWSFYWVAIISGILFPVVFFCTPETAFVRDAALNLDFGSVDSSEIDISRSEATVKTSSEAGIDSYATTKTSHAIERLASPPLDVQPTHILAKQSYARSLLPFNGRKTREAYWKLFLRPFPLFLQPGVLWACLTQGVMIGWTVLIGIVLSAIFILPPLNFTETKTGYLFTSALIGALAGFVISGMVADPIANALTRRNHGVFEPEFRLPLVAFQLLFSGIGLYGFGITANNLYKYSWIGPDVFFGFVLAGMVCGAVASAMYIVDAHRKFCPSLPCLCISRFHQLNGTIRRNRDRSLHFYDDFQEHVFFRTHFPWLRLATGIRVKEDFYCYRQCTGRHLPVGCFHV